MNSMRPYILTFTSYNESEKQEHMYIERCTPTQFHIINNFAKCALTRNQKFYQCYYGNMKHI